MTERKQRKNMAIFLAMLENDFSSAILEGAAKAAEEMDAHLLVFPMDLVAALYSEEEINYYRYQYNTLSSFMDSDSIDGVVMEYGTIVSVVGDEEKKELLSKIQKIPTVLLCEEAKGYSSICVDNDAGLREAILHMIDVHHCTKIGFVSGPKENQDANRRLQVFIDTMKSRNLYLGDDWICYGNFSVYIDDVLTEFVKKHPDVEALICANDSMAIGAYEILQKMGIKAGKDIFITGFDDTVSAELLDPPLTTVRSDPDYLSYCAMKALENSKELGKLPDVPTKLVVRESCGCCPSENGVRAEAVQNRLDPLISRKEKRERAIDNERRSNFERELGNITREMLFYKDNERDMYLAMLKTLQRVGFKTAGILLYEEKIICRRGMEWVQPETVRLCAAFRGEELYTFEKEKRLYPLKKLFHSEFYTGDERREVLVLPLFFGETQMGLLLVEAQRQEFHFAFQLAGQISNTLAIIDTMRIQEAMKQELEEANHAKSRFLAHMSHEIRTPINSIIGFNEMILRESREAPIAEYASDVKSAANVLLALVNNILDFSKIEAGKMCLVEGEYSLKDLMNDAVCLITDRARKKGLQLNLVYDSRLPSRLYGDSDRLRQILLNLLSNAVKYTKEGSVTLQISGEVKGDVVQILFSVKDTGIGIKEEDMKHLFEEFERLEENRNRHIEGTGLGVNITVELLKLMNSQLKVQSVYNEGSEFSFAVTQKIIDGTPLGEETSSKPKGKTPEKTNVKPFTARDVRILVVDDNDMNRKVLRHLLKGTLIELDDVNSGKACLDMVKEHRYDVILLDHMMPEMDGIETLEQLFIMDKFRADQTPVIALTANAIKGAEEMYLEHGFDDYLSKPVLPEKLYETLRKYISPEKLIES